MKRILRFYATQDEIQALKDHASRTNTTMSEVIRSKVFEPTLRRKAEPLKQRNADTPKKTQRQKQSLTREA